MSFLRLKIRAASVFELESSNLNSNLLAPSSCRRGAISFQ